MCRSCARARARVCVCVCVCVCNSWVFSCVLLCVSVCFAYTSLSASVFVRVFSVCESERVYVRVCVCVPKKGIMGSPEEKDLGTTFLNTKI